MPSIFDRYFSVQGDDKLAAQKSRLLLMLITIMSIASLLTLLKDIVFGTVRPDYLAAELLAPVIFGVFYWYTRRGHRWPAYAFLTFVAFIIPFFVRDNLADPLALAIAVPVVIAPLTTAPWLCIPVAAAEGVMLYAFNFALGHPFPNPLTLVILGVLSVLSWLSSWTLENALKESQRNASALTESNRELQANRALLESSMRDLQRRSAQLVASAEVGRAATTILETDQLIRQAVELIRERFGLYYVGLFLMEEARSERPFDFAQGDGTEWAVLRAGTGEAGRAMLARSHRIRIGEGMVGWSVAHAQARIALDVGEDAVRLATAELPDTRSEAALPLRSRGQVLGALTVQSDQPAAFDQDTIVVLQTMVDQVAVAIDNARLFAETQAALNAARRAYGELSREAWAALLRVQPDLGYRSGAHGVTSAGDVWRPEMEQALLKGETVQYDKTDTEGKLPLAVPIKVRGNVIGVLDTYKPDGAGAWTSEEIELVETLADQAGMALESARLYQDAQRRAARERLTREITDKMRRAVDIDDLMQTAVRETAAVLGASMTYVQLSTPPEPAEDKGKQRIGKETGKQRIGKETDNQRTGKETDNERSSPDGHQEVGQAPSTGSGQVFQPAKSND